MSRFYMLVYTEVALKLYFIKDLTLTTETTIKITNLDTMQFNLKL